MLLSLLSVRVAMCCRTMQSGCHILYISRRRHCHGDTSITRSTYMYVIVRSDDKLHLAKGFEK
jgi:hypothetical protein